MIQIHILPGKPKVLEGVSSKTGKPYKIVQQAAACQLADGSAAAFMIQPPRDLPPYAAGQYTLGPDSIYVMDGELRFSAKLVPVSGGAR